MVSTINVFYFFTLKKLPKFNSPVTILTATIRIKLNVIQITAGLSYTQTVNNRNNTNANGEACKLYVRNHILT